MSYTLPVHTYYLVKLAARTIGLYILQVQPNQVPDLKSFCRPSGTIRQILLSLLDTIDRGLCQCGALVKVFQDRDHPTFGDVRLVSGESTRCTNSISRPCKALFALIPVTDDVLLLSANWHAGRWSGQSCCEKPTTRHRMACTSWLALSVPPSVCGWCAVERRSIRSVGHF